MVENKKQTKLTWLNHKALPRLLRESHQRTMASHHAHECPSDTFKTQCSVCNLGELCLTCGLNPQEIDKVDKMVQLRKRLKRGERLYHAGEKFDSIYAVRSGFFKTGVLLEDGRDQVTGFQMAGELLGLDGIGTEHYVSNATALEDSEVCVIGFQHFEYLSREIPSLQKYFHKVMSREIARDHSVMMLLGSMRAEERLAAFLLNLSQRFTARGYSHNEFNLRMTREEIGSYLGLKLETVSRAFSRFQETGLINVQQKYIHILDVEGLKKTLSHSTH